VPDESKLRISLLDSFFSLKAELALVAVHGHAVHQHEVASLQGQHLNAGFGDLESLLKSEKLKKSNQSRFTRSYKWLKI
jgi:hypothetical protein